MISAFTKESWDGKVVELNGSILQSWAWGEFQESVGQKVHRFSAEDFICQAVETDLPMGKKYLYCPRGPVGNTQAALDDLKTFESNPAMIFARVEPAQAVDLPKAAKETQPTNNWVLNLEKSEEELLISMKPKTRYNINLASRKGVMIKEGTQADLIGFFQLMLETAKRNQFKLHPQDYYLQMWAHLAPKNLKLLLATYQGQVLGGMLLSTFGGTATYLHGGSSEKLKEAMAPYLLHWEAIKLSKKSGCKIYDFGGIAPSNEPGHPWAGITRFKKGFGGLEVTYPGAFDLIFSPVWYNAYKNVRSLRKFFR